MLEPAVKQTLFLHARQVHRCYTGGRFLLEPAVIAESRQCSCHGRHVLRTLNARRLSQQTFAAEEDSTCACVFAGCRSYAKGIGTAFEKRQDLRVIICNALATLCLQNRKALKVHLHLICSSRQLRQLYVLLNRETAAAEIERW